jgi:hypothetical protein
MVTSSRQFAITGQQGSIECFGESDIHGIICGDVVAQFPCPWQRSDMSVSIEREIGEILKRFFAPRARYDAGVRVASEDLRDLDIN